MPDFEPLRGEIIVHLPPFEAVRGAVIDQRFRKIAFGAGGRPWGAAQRLARPKGPGFGPLNTQLSRNDNCKPFRTRDLQKP